MATFGWVLLAGAFLMLVMVANNSWPWVWAKISSGVPQPGQGNPIVPTPSPDVPPTGPLPEPTPGLPPGSIVPTPPPGTYTPPSFGNQ